MRWRRPLLAFAVPAFGPRSPPSSCIHRPPSASLLLPLTSCSSSTNTQHTNFLWTSAKNAKDEENDDDGTAAASLRKLLLERLGTRLRPLYDFIPPTAQIVADVGTDHALLCIALAGLPWHPQRQTQLKHVIGIDKALDPLRVARQNLKYLIDAISLLPPTVKAKLGPPAGVEIREGDGLDALLVEDKVDTLCMAGLGSATMIEIMKRARGTAVGEQIKHLVLQPYDSRPQFLRDVREFIQQEDKGSPGFQVHDEQIVQANGRWFVTLAASRGESLEEGSSSKEGNEQSRQPSTSWLLGEALRQRTINDPTTKALYLDYLKHHHKWLSRIRKAQGQENEDDETAVFIKAIEEMQRELGEGTAGNGDK